MGKLKAVVICVLCLILIVLVALMTLSPPISRRDSDATANLPAGAEENEDPEPPETSPESETPESQTPPETPESPESQEQQENLPEETPDETETPEAVQEEELPSRGFYEDIPPDVREKMAGISMPDGAEVSYDDLSYLTVFFQNFDGNRAVGNLVVAKELADEMLDIFAELYDIGYPIESVKLIDEFYDMQTAELDSLDRASMGNNNTSAFCYRAMNDAGTLSQHAFGRAIDLNPKINPFVSGSAISPANAVKYADRSGEGLSDIELRAMIHKDDEVYKIFTSRGWKWGCEIWNGVYDYQHFQKPA